MCGVADHEAIALEVGYAHAVAGLVQAFGQCLHFGGHTLQAMDQQDGMFTAGKFDSFHASEIETV